MNKLVLKHPLSTSWIDAVAVKCCWDTLQVASWPGDWNCVFKLSSNSVISNFVCSKSPADWRLKVCFQVVFKFSDLEFCSLQITSQQWDWKCKLLQLLFHISIIIRFKLSAIGEFGFLCLRCQLRLIDIEVCQDKNRKELRPSNRWPKPLEG